MTTAAPDQLLGKLQGLSQLVGALPQAVTLNDGSSVNPRGIMRKQLMDAGLTPEEPTVKVLVNQEDPVKAGLVDDHGLGIKRGREAVTLDKEVGDSTRNSVDAGSSVRDCGHLYMP